MSEINLSDLNARTIPLQCRFSDITPLSIPGKSSRKRFLANNAGVFTNIQNSIIRIPLSDARGMIDPALTTFNFTITNTASDRQQIDGSFNNIIARLRISSTSGGQDLEDCRGYAYVHNMLSNIKYGHSTRVSKRGEGYGSIMTDAPTTGTGETILEPNGVMNVQIPLMSSLIGSSATKYLPLHLTGPLMVEIELSSNCFFLSINSC